MSSPTPAYRLLSKRRLASVVHRRRVLWRLRRQGADVALWHAWQDANRAGLLAMKPEDFVRGQQEAS